MHRGQSQRSVTEISSNTSISQRFTRPPVIGPLTFEDSVLSSKWKKEDSSSSVYSFDGPLPGPVRPVDGSTQANNLFLRFFLIKQLPWLLKKLIGMLPNVGLNVVLQHHVHGMISHAMK